MALLADPRCWLVALLAVALGLRLAVAWDDLPRLIRDVTSDDAYYYFQIAKNLAAGAGVSTDGETPTNGFHPLWLLLLTPVFAVTQQASLGLHLGLSLSAVFGTGTVALVYATLRELAVRPAAALAAAAFPAVHPLLVAESVNGLETGLAVFCIAFVVWGFVRLARQPTPPLRDTALLGAGAGLMMLARTDTLFVLPLMAGCFFLRQPGRQRWQTLGALAAAAGVVLLPWVVWNLAAFGTLVQVSSVAIAGPHQAHYLAEHGEGLSVWLSRGGDLTWRAFTGQLPHLYWVPRGFSTLPFFAALAAGAALLVWAPPATERRRTLRQVELLMVPGAGILLALLYHAGIRWWLREWYFAPVALLATLLLGVGLDRLQRGLAGSRGGDRAVVAAYAIYALAGLLWFGPHRSDLWIHPSPHRENQWAAARWIEAYTAPGARIGSFNSGILTYFSDRTVVNLDGVVNADAYRAKRENRLPGYMQAARLDYLVDLNPALLNTRCWTGPEVWCEVVTVVGEPHAALGGGRVSILALDADRIPERGKP